MFRARMLPVLLLLVLVLAVAGCGDDAERLDFVVENSGQPVGRLTMRLHPVAADSSIQLLEVESDISLSALGKSMDLHREERLEIDPRTGRVVSIIRHMKLGDLELTGMVRVDDDSLHMTSLKGQRLHVPLAPDLFLEDGLHYRFLVDSLNAARPRDRWQYRTVDLDGGRIVDVTARWGPPDTLTVDDIRVGTTVIDMLYPALDVARRLWIDPADGRLLQVIGGDGMGLRRGRPAKGAEPEVVMLDSLILGPVSVRIDEPRTIRSMTVRAVIDSPGLPIDAADLDQPGQTFSGEVRGSRIDGVFTIAYPVYDGTDAPAFPPPPEAYADPDLQPYLAPEPLIESNDGDLVSLAGRLTSGVPDCWVAARTLAAWVDWEIEYDIPGGGTAARTLASRRGECGSHARLLAGLCRSVGIPARMVIGGMYFVADQPYFGQHGWTEIHMGPAGWVPLDATISETEVLNSGHIRLGEEAAFQPVSLEILAYELVAPE